MATALSWAVSDADRGVMCVRRTRLERPEPATCRPIERQCAQRLGETRWAQGIDRNHSNARDVCSTIGNSPSTRSGRAGSRRRSPCRRSPGSRRASIDAVRWEDMMPDRRGYTRCAVGATPATDSATDPGTLGRPATGDTRARDPQLVGSAPWRVRQAAARWRA
jgi:hypothetical protein